MGIAQATVANYLSIAKSRGVSKTAVMPEAEARVLSLQFRERVLHPVIPDGDIIIIIISAEADPQFSITSEYGRDLSSTQ